jgi:hypothetical protein
MISRTLTVVLFALFLVVPINAAAFQKRDHLTPQEVDLVKEAQILDKRIEVFIKAAERRLIVINGTAATNAKQLKKDSEKWGELPTGSRFELVGDIAQILDEAITNIDDVSSRDERNPLIPKALRKLATSETPAEISSLESLNEYAQSILGAVTKLPPEVDKKAAKKNDKN